MGHTYHQNLGHVVFHVDRVLLRGEDLRRIWAYIAGIARENGVSLLVVGGTEDHVHLLGDFPLTQSIPEVMRHVKASSSRWIKGIHGQYADFSWQQGYGYFSVSASRYPLVANYIRTQREHHARMSAVEEFARFMEKHALGSDGDLPPSPAPDRVHKS